MKGLGSIFGKVLGGFASGGDVLTSGVYDVGEVGTERVYLPQGSHVVPHSQMGGGAPTYNIDARGTDPAVTAQHTRAAMAATHASAVATAQHNIAERQRRTAQR